MDSRNDCPGAARRLVGVQACGPARAPRSIRARAASAACEVVEVSPSSRQSSSAAVDMPADYDPAGRDGASAASSSHEVTRAPVSPSHIPSPRDRRSAPSCRAFIAAPDVRQSPEAWAERSHMSPRTFSRHFRQQTGMAFSAWRQRACVVSASARSAAGTPVTAIASDFGYQSPAAFSTMFRRVSG
ncbi:hypothetical protein OY671_009213, partial [Metschnikowia pulcherrima]